MHASPGLATRVVALLQPRRLDFPSASYALLAHICTAMLVVAAVNMPCGPQEGSLVEKNAVLAPGTVLPPGRLIPGGQLWAGNPARYVRDLTKDEVCHTR